MASHEAVQVKQMTPVRDREAPGSTEKIDRLLAAKRPGFPCLVIDLDVVPAKYSSLRTSFPDATIFYAVKANPAPDALAANADRT